MTGSLIKRIEGETALPVVTISIDELTKAGVTNAEQAVKFITQNQSNTVTSGSVSATHGAAAYADLRSLGFSTHAGAVEWQARRQQPIFKRCRRLEHAAIVRGATH